MSLVADFETTTDPEDCRVWAWGLMLIGGGSFSHGIDIESFCKRVSVDNSVIYFHNLAFDGSFILDYIMREGYAHVVEKYPSRKKTFTTLISNMGKFYSIKVKWENGVVTEFRDSMKKLPMSVANVAKAFNLDIGKGEIDYHKARPVGHTLSPEELDYLYRDVYIIAMALAMQERQGMKGLTVGADALSEFKSLQGTNFKTLYPVLPEAMDAEIRAAYRGGFTYADPRHAGKRVGSGSVYDVNSLYPSVMYDCLLPYGEPQYFSDVPDDFGGEYPLYTLTLTFTASLKDGHIPCIQIKNSPHFAATEYVTEISEPITMTCTSVDFELWNSQYDLDVLSYEGGWAFRAMHGAFDSYIEKWSRIKAESTGGMRAIAKLHLNSLYGKFATNPNVTGKVPLLEDGCVKLVMGEEETREPVYTAVGAFITAYARERTIRAAQANYGTFLYADTDSLHLLTRDPVGLDIHPTRMGAWKHEGNFIEAIYVRAKCYCELMENDDGTTYYETHIAGLPREIQSQVTFDDFHNGRIFEGKLVPKRVPGGVVLTKTQWCLTM